MIIIKKIFGQIDGRNYSEPERTLTKEEEEKIIAIWGDENNYWYFTKEDIESPEWKAYQEHIKMS